MTTTLQPGQAIPSDQFTVLRRRAIFECCKWDPQVGDTSVLASFPLVIPRSEWHLLCRAAERLAAETLAVEAELMSRPDLHSRLGFTGALSRLLAVEIQPRDERVRVMRFDFHPTTDGWRISEVNSDVPGGFVESSGFSALMAEHFPGLAPAGDPAAALTAAIASELHATGTVALVHATAFTDDRQVMVHLARRFTAVGMHPVLAAPDHLRWRDGRAFIQTDWFTGEVDFIFRFYPAEWLPNLPQSCGWQNFFRGTRVPQCNPPTALLTQNKRWPLLQRQLETPTPEWERWLPETRDPRDVDCRDPRWIVKPALGRVGDMVTIQGLSPDRELRAAHKAARRHPDHWVAQRRFDCVPVRAGGCNYFPCLGIYVINGQASGAYGRIAGRPLIDHNAQDIAVLLSSEPASSERAEPVTHDTLGVV